jgi:hypothetical protein
MKKDYLKMEVINHHAAGIDVGSKPPLPHDCIVWFLRSKISIKPQQSIHSTTAKLTKKTPSGL